MNKQKRGRLAEAVAKLEGASGIMQSVLDDEQESLYNLGERFSETEKYQAMEEIAETLEEQIDTLNGVIETVGGI